ncbi:MAG: helix-turn-helix domain-containing protein [Bacteroidota bacterium]
MRVHPFKIPATVKSAIGLQKDFLPHFYDIFHQHPEIQLTLVLQSTGTLFLGDYVGEFQPGNVFVIGASVPHVFKNDPVYYNADSPEIAKSISIFFKEDLLGKDFLQLPEAWRIKEFLLKTQRGMKFGPGTFDKLEPLVNRIFAAEDTDKIIYFLQILKILCEDEFLLTQHTISYDADEIEGKRLNSIFQFTMNEFGREIAIEEVAEIANLTRTSFCRYFKKRTRKTYIDFLLEVRVSHACNLLMKQDLSISAIGDLCGFNNISNFNRQFKRLKGMPPTEFRRKAHWQGLAAAS